MTVREILDSVEKELHAARATIIRLEDVRKRIKGCVRAEPAPAAEEEGVLKLCDRNQKAPKRRAA